MDWATLLTQANNIVRSKPTWKRFIDGTPLQNDIAVWMAEFASLKMSKPNPKCVCGDTESLFTVHRDDGPCFRYAPLDWPVYDGPGQVSDPLEKILRENDKLRTAMQGCESENKLLRQQIKKLGAMVPLHGGGTFENDPPDAILDAAMRYLKRGLDEYAYLRKVAAAILDNLSEGSQHMPSAVDLLQALKNSEIR